MINNEDAAINEPKVGCLLLSLSCYTFGENPLHKQNNILFLYSFYNYDLLQPIGN